MSKIINDKWQRGQIGISILSNDSRFLDSQLRKVVNFVDLISTVEILKFNIETF